MANKKLSPKEKRELEQTARKQKYQAQNEEREKAIREAALKAEQEEMEKKVAALTAAVSTNEKKEPAIRHSLAKAAGLKSTFVVGNELLMTSFGRGNDAVLEKRIIGGTVTDLNASPAFSVKPIEKEYEISGRVNAVAADPLRSVKPVGQDIIGCKDALERSYFGRVFDDNIHIQLIYNILDIEKILSIHINNIIYTIDNIAREDTAEYGDFIGYLSDVNSYGTYCNPESLMAKKGRDVVDKVIKSKNVFDKLCKSPYLGYFGSAFIETGNDKKAKIGGDKVRDERDIYTMFCLLGSARQMLAHSKNFSRNYLYALESKRPEILAFLNKIYAERVTALNKDFATNSAKDMTIYFDACGITSTAEKEKILREYYDFVVRKEFKNRGYAFKKLRERLLTMPELAATKADTFNSVRSKFYKLFDFALYRYYIGNPEQEEEMVSALRACIKDDDKERIYSAEAIRVWQSVKTTVLRILFWMDGEKIKSVKADEAVSATALNGIQIAASAEYFTEFIYMLTLLIDGKEINDLLTTLINKFENIAGFVAVLKDMGMSTAFKADYAMFAKSDLLARELRAVNSFARMSKPHPSAKRAMFVEAAVLLGNEKNEEELGAYFDELLDKKRGKTVNGKKDNSLRNFIASNVIESDRFAYLVRYINPQKAKNLAMNSHVLDFVLCDIPDTQIERYYESCKLGINGNADDKRRALRDMLLKTRFEQFESVNTGNKATPQQKIEKEKYKTVITLYITVLYLLTKNLVYVNSRYFLAFHCLERDAQLKGSGAGYNAPYKELAERFVTAPNYRNIKAKNYILNNIGFSDEWAIKKYRNTVAHLGAVRNADCYIGDIAKFTSYFELYHYLMQRSLMAKDAFEKEKGYRNDGVPNEHTYRYFADVAKYHGCSKDFIKALNVPFAYNLARYKNLSISGRFDRNRPEEHTDKW